MGHYRPQQEDRVQPFVNETPDNGLNDEKGKQR